MHGCDISEFQGTVNFDQLKTGASFVIIRAGYTGGVDKQFKRNQSEARRVGMHRGYYWFAYPERQPVSEHDADAFLNTIGELQPGEIVVLDYEVNTGSTGWCEGWLDRVKQRTGVKPYLYTNQGRTVSLNWTSVKAKGYPLWVAIFDNTPSKAVNTGGWNYPIKQYTADGQMPGIGGAVDLDIFRESDFTKYGKGGSMPASQDKVDDVATRLLYNLGELRQPAQSEVDGWVGPGFRMEEVARTILDGQVHKDIQAKLSQFDKLAADNADLQKKLDAVTKDPNSVIITTKGWAALLAAIKTFFTKND